MIIDMSEERKNRTERRLKIIKILLKDVITRQKEEEKFIDYIFQNDYLYKICIINKSEFVLFEILEMLGITDEDEQDEIYAFINQDTKDIDKLIEAFCKKYHI